MVWPTKKHCTNQMPESFAHRKNLWTKRTTEEINLSMWPKCCFFCWCCFIHWIDNIFSGESDLFVYFFEFTRKLTCYHVRWFFFWLLPIWIPLAFEFRNESDKIGLFGCLLKDNCNRKRVLLSLLVLLHACFFFEERDIYKPCKTLLKCSVSISCIYLYITSLTSNFK